MTEFSDEDREFLSSVKTKPESDLIFRAFYVDVYNTNKMLGLTDKQGDELSRMIDLYAILYDDERAELVEAIQEHNLAHVIKEAIDVMVVGGFLHHLMYNKFPDLHSVGEHFSIDSDSADFLECLEFGSFLSVILEGCEDLLLHLPVDYRAALAEVVASNLSKFPTVEQLRCMPEFTSPALTDSDILHKVALELEGERYQDVTYEPVEDSQGQTRYVFWSSYEYGVPKHKYLKAPTYFKANIKDLLN